MPSVGLFRICASPATAFQSAFTFTSAPGAIEFSLALSLADIAPGSVIVAAESDNTCPLKLSPFAVPIVTSPVFVPEIFDDTIVPVILNIPPIVRFPAIFTDPPIEALFAIDAILRNAVSVTISFP